jgi:hypothetical protein
LLTLCGGGIREDQGDLMTRVRKAPARSPGKLRSVALLTAAASIGGWDAEARSDGGLFDSPLPLEIRLEAPWKSLTRKMEAGRSVNGHLYYEKDAGEDSKLEVEITIRGTSRLEVCDFPLLTLEMQPEDIVGTPFSGQRVIHLTTQCRKEKRFRDFLAREYLSYQAYRLLGEPALGVRIGLVEYLDTDRKRATESAPAFFLEDLDHAAARLGGVWLEPEAVEIQALAPETLALLGLFQFMLGNTDWSVRGASPGEPCCHNVAILGPSEGASDLLPVPYDLDSTGLVDPPYASPVQSLPIRQVRQRLYRGFCASNSYLPQAVTRIQARRAELIALFEDNLLLSSPAKKGTRKYLESYFGILDDPQKLKKRILDNCRDSQNR